MKSKDNKKPEINLAVDAKGNTIPNYAVTYSIRKDILEAFNEHCDKNGFGKSKLITILLERYLLSLK